MKALILATAFLALPLFAVPQELTYQATVTDADGNLVGLSAPVSHEVIVRIWDDANGGNFLWSERHPNTSIYKGRFAIILGRGQEVPTATVPEPRPLLSDILDEPGRFAEITIPNIDGNGNSRTFGPRQGLGASAVAIRSQVAESIKPGALGGADLADGSISSRQIEVRSLSGAVLAAGSVGSAQLAPGAITGSAIQDDALTLAGDHFANASLLAGDLQNAAITNAVLANDGIDSRVVLDGDLIQEDFALNSLTGANLVDGSVPSSVLAEPLNGPVFLSSTQIRRIPFGDIATTNASTDNRSNTHNVATLSAAAYALPAGVNGLILRVRVNDVAREDQFIVFPGSDGGQPDFPGASLGVSQPGDSDMRSFVSTDDDRKAARSNSIVVNRDSEDGDSFDREATIYCPVEDLGNGSYRFRYFVTNKTSSGGGSVLIVIGYY